MDYPTKSEALNAEFKQLCVWVRFLPSPGYNCSGTDDFTRKHILEKQILETIFRRFTSAGGMTPEMSKEIGWDKSKYI